MSTSNADPLPGFGVGFCRHESLSELAVGYRLVEGFMDETSADSVARIDVFVWGGKITKCTSLTTTRSISPTS